MKKTALVTGGTQGIGKAIVEKLADDGHLVVIGFRSQSEKAHELTETLKSQGADVKAIYCDISSRTSIQEAMSTIKTIDVLVNNAAISQNRDFLQITDHDWDQMMNVTLRGAFMFSQEAVPSMLERKWGRIINITSIGGQWGGINQVHYAAAKAGLTGLTMSLSRLYSERGVTANAVSPGIIETEMTAWITPADKENLTKDIPAGRFGIAEEVAATVSFLASESAAYITGQTINVNGGMLRT